MYISHLCILLYYNKWGITVIYSLPEGYKGIYDPHIPPYGYYFDQSELLFKFTSHIIIPNTFACAPALLMAP